MNTAVYIGKNVLVSDERLQRLMDELKQGGCNLHILSEGETLSGDHDMLLSVGGDGTYLSASSLVAQAGIPVVGVNLGRLGFLSENRPEDVAQAILSGDYTVENRLMLQTDVVTGEKSIDDWPYALNEMSVRRGGPAMLAVEVSVDGVQLPTYWADGLLIVLPESKVLIISPIAPHNLNVRPLVVPDSSEIKLKMHSRDGLFEFSADNRTAVMNESVEINISMAQFSLKRVRLNKSNFINALTEKLFWGEDVRNTK